MRPSLLERIKSDVLVCEGAMGSELAARGVSFRNTAELNLTQPDAILGVHRDYQAAGAQVFQTNTFAGNLLMLERAGLAEQAAPIQTAAVGLAREAIGPEALLALNIGPTGHLPEPYGDLPHAPAVACFRQQLEVMLPLDVDFVLLETFEALEEVEAALEALRELRCQLPVAATMSFSNPQGATMMGVNGQQAAHTLAALGVDIIGANCGDQVGLREALRQMAEVTDRPLMAQPNAGQPELVEGRTAYRQSAEDFGRYAQELLELGVRIIGGCCGTRTAHIQQLARLARAGA
jgi:5-methyltetrahydrofolate--homocysteine methyltransferase